MDINITGPINQLGYGICTTNLVHALCKRGHTPALWCVGPVDMMPKYAQGVQQSYNRQAKYNAQAPSVRIYHQFDLAQHVGRKAHCGFPIFELDRFNPTELNHLKQQDFLFVPSGWATDVLIDHGFNSDRLGVVPFGVDQEIFRPSPKEHKDGDQTVFLNVGKWELRKGHDVIIDAFCKAFTKQDNVRLVMACVNPCFRTNEEAERYNMGWISTYMESTLGQAGKVTIIGKRLPSQKEVADLMAQADVGVFPARAEGWNLDLSEMLAMGKHVIATDYSAHTEYLTFDNARLMDVGVLEDAHDGVWFDASAAHWEGKPGRWAELNDCVVDQLVEHMRQTHKLKQEGKLVLNQAGIDTMKSFTWEHSADKLVAILEKM